MLTIITLDSAAYPKQNHAPCPRTEVRYEKAAQPASLSQSVAQERYPPSPAGPLHMTGPWMVELPHAMHAAPGTGSPCPTNVAGVVYVVASSAAAAAAAAGRVGGAAVVLPLHFGSVEGSQYSVCSMPFRSLKPTTCSSAWPKRPP